LNQVINGLETLAFNQSQGIFRLTKTKRLTTASANLTGLFYDNSLKSFSSIQIPINTKSAFSNLFDSNGGCTVVYLPINFDGTNNKAFFNLLLKVAKDLLNESQNSSVGVISAKRDLENTLVHEYYNQNNNLDGIHFSTVHRAQGLTVSYCIFYMPLEASHMDLDPKLFNVATSRAQKGTCIITRESFELISNVNPILKEFMSNCKNVTNDFLQLFNNQLA
jgi:hypothetical protein